MKSKITSRGQTVVPASIRHRFHLTSSNSLEWIVDGNTIQVIPVPGNPVDAFRGRGRGGATKRLLLEREKERKQE
jgi:AbrB family looped-hinge helix DNA binding protein